MKGSSAYSLLTVHTARSVCCAVQYADICRHELNCQWQLMCMICMVSVVFFALNEANLVEKRASTRHS